MLYELSVENFALIQEMTLPLGSQLNALTGETGAGKSLIVDAVALLIGGRANEGLIRSGSNRCRVEAIFYGPFPQDLLSMVTDFLDDENDDTLILSRELVKGGRSICRINGCAVNLSMMRSVGRLLVNIHGQHEHMLLLEEDKQLSLLDSFGGVEQLAAQEAVASSYAALAGIKRKIAQFEQDKSKRAQRLDWLSFQINEIEAVAPQYGEEAELTAEANLLANGEKLLNMSRLAYESLSEGGAAIELLADASTAIKQVAAIDQQLAVLAERLDSLYYEAEDISREISSYQDGISIDSLRLDTVETRLSQFGRLKKKYGGSIDQVLDYLQNAKDEYTELADFDISGDRLLEQLMVAERDYLQKADILTEKRSKTAVMLAEAITGELQKLAMPQAIFRIDLLPTDYSTQGKEKALFMICSNTGEEFKPVAKIASGGELSRIVLGMKVILSRLDRVPTLIFDEVDTGLSGKALSSVAERLSVVGKSAQTIVVSHAAVMAAAADNQISISKTVDQGRTVISAKQLTDSERIQEVARMIAGNNVSEITLRQAAEMLDKKQ